MWLWMPYDIAFIFEFSCKCHIKWCLYLFYNPAETAVPESKTWMTLYHLCDTNSYLYYKSQGAQVAPHILHLLFCRIKTWEPLKQELLQCFTFLVLQYKPVGTFETRITTVILFICLEWYTKQACHCFIFLHSIHVCYVQPLIKFIEFGSKQKSSVCNRTAVHCNFLFKLSHPACRTSMLFNWVIFFLATISFSITITLSKHWL